MAQKCKQHDEEVANIDTVSRTKRIKINTKALKRKRSDPMPSDMVASHPPKKLKLRLRFWSTAATAPSNNESPAQERAIKTPPKTSSASSRLVPRGARKTAKLGQRDESLLRMLCDDEDSGEAKELHFRNMPHSSINWNDAHHINKINNWRNQIYGRAGLKTRSVTLWLPDEELWFELYFHLTIAESRGRGILLSRTQSILEAFNETFVDRTIQDHHGKDTAPRLERQANAFSSKFNRMCPELRARLQQCVFGKTGDVFVPRITLEMLRAYKRMKLDMAAKGIHEESVYPDNLQEWRHLFSHLPSMGDIAMQTGQQAELRPEIEYEVAIAMVNMAQQSATVEHEVAFAMVNMANQSASKTAGKDGLFVPTISLTNCPVAKFSGSAFRYSTPPQKKHTVAGSKTPMPSLTASLSSSLRSDDPLTPPRNSLFSKHAKVARPATPSRELDITSLIASPD
jgi:hypothetical protein